MTQNCVDFRNQKQRMDQKTQDIWWLPRPSRSLTVLGEGGSIPGGGFGFGPCLVHVRGASGMWLGRGGGVHCTQ